MSNASQITNLTQAVGNLVKGLRVQLFGSASGGLSGLATTDKTSIVAAINEVNAKPSPAPADASETVKGIVELATLTEVATGTDATRAVTAAGVRQERTALKAEILGGAAAAQDTLAELKTYIDGLDSADEGQIQGVITALSSRVRTDTAAQGLDSTQQSNARTNISVYSKAEIGDPETDYVAILNAALV